MNTIAPVPVASQLAFVPVTTAELDALLAEVDSKPNLGVVDSAGLIDDAAAVAYAQGQEDYAAGIYWPGSLVAPAFDAYVTGWRDAEDTAEYEDDILDREYRRHGQ